MATTDNVAAAVKYDLTHTLAKCLDRHLIFPLLEFLQSDSIAAPLYSNEDLLAAKLELLSGTNMVDFAMDVYRGLNDCEDVPEFFKERRQQVIANLTDLKHNCFVNLLADEAKVEALKAESNFNMNHLQENFEGINAEALESLYWVAKFQYECGNYADAITYLETYRLLSGNADRCFAALWGKFSAEILMHEWDDALGDMNLLKEQIDARSFVAPVVQLQQRTWLIHWSLFIFFNHPNGRNVIIDTLLSDRPGYLNAIQTNCPHILRYLTAAVIVNQKRRRNVLKELVRVIRHENYTYKDPITEFVECLYVNFDFDGAQKKLAECEIALANDFFLSELKEEFVENARLCIFETYCRIHQTIDIAMLAEKLNMDVDAAERWIVNLIRQARLDAKIDSESHTVIMGTANQSVYQQVIEKTKNLTFRTYVVANNLERKQHQLAQNAQTAQAGR